jgi:uncharacterized membrane protein YbhN (UPF0104 family)
MCTVDRSSALNPVEPLPRALDDAPPAPQSLPAAASAWRRRALVTAKVGFAAVLMYWLVNSERLDIRRLAELRPSWPVTFFVALVFLSMVAPAIRWWYLMTIQELNVPLWPVIRATWLGYATSIFLPGAAGGDAVRVLIVLQGRSSGRIRALSTVIVDRGLGLYTLSFLGALSFMLCLLQPDSSPVIAEIAGVSVAIFLTTTAVVCSLAYSRTRALALWLVPAGVSAALEDSWSRYRQHPIRLSVCFGLSIIAHLFNLGTLVAAWCALGVVVPVITVLGIGPLVGLANMLPLTPGGVGVGEAAADQLFGMAGVSCGADVFLLTRALGIALAVPAFCFPKGAVRAA